MRKVVRAGWFRVPCIGLLVAACDPQSVREPAAAFGDRDSVQPSRMVQWMFDPSPGEKKQLDSLLRIVGGAAIAPDFRFGGELYPFGSVGQSQRYLLVASRDTTQPPPVYGEQEFLLYVLSEGGVAEPYRVSGSNGSSHPFAVATLEDLDSDGLVDLAYCLGGSEAAGGKPYIIGYQGDRWYTIAPPVDRELCG